MPGQNYLRVYLTHFPTFLPAIVLSFGIFAFAPYSIAFVGFLIMNQTLYLAAASAGLSCLPTETFRSLLGKRGIVHAVWSVLFLIIVIFCCGLPLVIMADNWPHAPLRFLIGVVVLLFIFGLCMCRIWPVYGLLMVWLGYSPEDRTEGIWLPYDTGDALVEAWRLTRRGRIFWSYSIPALMSLFGLLFIPMFFAVFVFDDPSPAARVSFAIYSVGLAPLLNLVLAERSYALVGPPSPPVYTFVPRRRQPSASHSQQHAQGKNGPLETALHDAISEHQADEVLRLLAQGANPNAYFSNSPILWTAVSYGDSTVIQALLDAGAELQDSCSGHTAVMAAASHGDNLGLACLLANRADTNRIDRSGNTALHFAVTSRWTTPETVRLLLAAGADPNLTDKSGKCAVEIAIARGRPDMVEVFETFKLSTRQETRETVQTHPDSSLTRSENVRAAQLVLAAQQGNIERAEHFLTQPPPLPQVVLARAFVTAYEEKHEAIALLLLQHGLPATASLEDGTSLLLRATAHGPVIPSVIHSLLQGGAARDQIGQVGQLGKDKATPLIWLAGMVDELYSDQGRYRVHDSSDLSAIAEAMREMIEQGAQVNQPDSSGQTALFFAVEWRDLEGVKVLLDAGADPNTQDRYGNTALMRACSSRASDDTLAIVQLLIERGADPLIQTNDGRTAIAAATANNKKDILEYLFSLSPGIQQKQQAQPVSTGADLVAAAAQGRQDRLDRLLASGLSLESRDQDGRTALHMAALRRRPELVLYLLHKGASIEARENKGMTPLAVAALQRNQDSVSHLLVASASVNAANTSGQTPLMLAASRSQLASVELLVQHGADINATDRYGGTALMYAVQEGGTQNDVEAATKTISCLLAHKASVNAVNTDGQTALMLLLGCRDYTRASRDKASMAVIPLLLAAGADIHLQDASGRTALHVAAEQDSIESAKQLLRAGARKDVRDTYGETPAQLAAAYQYAELAQLLRE